MGSSVAIGQVTEQHAETAMRCDKGQCRATSIRQSKTDHRSPNLTTLDFWGGAALDMISISSQDSEYSLSTPSELFITNSSIIPVRAVTGVPGYDNSGVVDITTVDPIDFSRRATMLLNTAIQIFLSPVGFAGGLPTSNMTIYGPPHVPVDGVKTVFAAEGISGYELDGIFALAYNPPFMAAASPANITTITGIYKPNLTWVIILIATSSILAFIGAIGILTSLTLKAPDVFDPVIGLTYGNPYLATPNYGSNMGATERARMLKGLKVRLGDIKSNDQIGRIALGRIGQVQPIVGGKLYQ